MGNTSTQTLSDPKECKNVEKTTTTKSKCEIIIRVQDLRSHGPEAAIRVGNALFLVGTRSAALNTLYAIRALPAAFGHPLQPRVQAERVVQPLTIVADQQHVIAGVCPTRLARLWNALLRGSVTHVLT